MRQLAVVAYPRFNEADSARLESIRRRHDPQAELIPAHMTLMFPVMTTVELIAAQANRCAAGSQAFDIRITQAKAHCTNGLSYVFMLPTLGSDRISALHDKLYEGDFRRHLRHELPYRPHITVARKTNYAECASLASSINDKGIDMSGRIDSIRVISIGPAEITSVAEFGFGCAVATT